MSEPTPQSQGPDPDAQTPPPARKRARTPGAWRAWLPSGAQVLTMFIGLLISSNLMLWLEVTRLKEGPAVAVVGVKDMTKAYIERIGSANLSPTEAANPSRPAGSVILLMTAGAFAEAGRTSTRNHWLKLAG